MGLSRSKFPISYDEACRRAGQDVMKRLRTTFDRCSSNNGLLPQATFLRDVFGDGVPPKLAEAMYKGFRGHQKGIPFSDLVKGLVLVTQGTIDEKAKFLAQLVCGEDGILLKVNLLRMIADCDIHPTSEDLDTLFNQENWCTSEEFIDWVKLHPHLASFTIWLLGDQEDGGMKLTADPDPPTFYQTLAKKFSVSAHDVMDLEKAYWALKSNNSKFDLQTFQNIISPPLPAKLCDRLFELFDVNCDGHIDLTEMVKGVALCCRRHIDDRIKLCFTLLDSNSDGLLDIGELTAAIELLTTLRDENTPSDQREEQLTSQQNEERHFSLLAEETLNEYASNKEQGLSADEFVCWVRDHGVGQSLVHTLLQVMFEVCHIRLGLRPSNTAEETAIVKGYMVRFHNEERRKVGATVHLIAAEWFDKWRLHTEYEIAEHPLEKVRQRLPVPITPVHVKQSPRSQSATYKNYRHKKMAQMNLCPVADVAPEPSSSQQPEVAEGVVMVEGEEEDDYSHVITTEPAATAAEECVPSSDQSDDSSIQLPPVDNRSLLVPETGLFKKTISLTNEGGQLIRNRELHEYIDYYVLPEEVWRALTAWYGSANYTGGPALPRTVKDDSGSVELYPIQFEVYKHTNYPPASKTGKTPWASIASWLGSLGIGNFGASSSEAPPPPGLGLPGEPIIPHRVLYYKATFDPDTTVLQVCERLQKVLHIKPEDLRIYDFINTDQPELLDNETMTLKDLNISDGHKILVETRNKDNSWPEELIALMHQVRNSENKEQEEKPKPQSPKVSPGATGLSNLGNTCFMNSALQCISNLQPLTIYFTEKEHLLEINKQNPLGMHGVMAKRYGELVHDLWSGHSKSITPLKFRFTVARYAPRFSSFQQQDAQELLAFVLDGIHEDLNRVKEKPYRELPDSDDRPDDEVADEAWRYHKERNDSIVVDLFQGQLKSVVQCGKCDMKSSKFDPFTFLSLPLPMDSGTNLEVIVVRLDGSQPVRYCLRPEMDEKYCKLKERIFEMTDIDTLSCYLVLVDVYGGTVRSFPQDSDKLSMGLSGWLYAFEVPSPPLIPVSSRSPTPEELNVEDEQANQDIDQPNSDQPDSDQQDSATSQESHQHQQSEEDETAEQQGAEVAVTNEREPEADEQEEAPVITPVDEVADMEGSTPDPVTKPEEDERELDSDEKTDLIAGEHAAAMATEADEPATKKTSLSPSPSSPPSAYSPHIHGFIFAVHRRTLRVEQYFVSTQKTRPVLFSIPMVVPCTSSTPSSAIYETIWGQVQRLVIPDPPNKEIDDEVSRYKSYPFSLKLVKRDGYYCCRCPWYRFCRGCPVPCDDKPLPPSALYLAIDWEDSFLHLKYQSAQERPVEHESMENMKHEDNKPVDLRDCFKAFSKPEELGEEEYWYCSKCQEHRPARKTLELWRLPKVLIIHLKRFQFHNGRWGKSQRPVHFPLNGLDPIKYMRRDTEDTSLLQQDMVPSSPMASPLPVSEETEERGLEPPEVILEMNKADKSDGVRDCEAVVENSVHQEEEKEGQGKERNEKKEEREPATEQSDEEMHRKECDVSVDKDREDNEEHARQDTPGQPEQDTSGQLGQDTSGQPEQDSLAGQATSSVSPVEVTENGVQGDGQAVLLPREPESTSELMSGVYKLFSITCHSGVMGGGHYTSFARNPNGHWYYYNDSSCKETTEERVQSESPYLLFYEQETLQQHYNDFRARGQGKKQDIGYTDDDRAFEQSLKSMAGKQPAKKSSGCSQQ